MKKTDDMTAVILAGGLGTRLRSALPDCPKCMAPVNGRPFLECLVSQITRAGTTEIVMCVGYMADVIERHFGDGNRHGCRIRYSREEELLGTGGAVSVARSLIASREFTVLNGDSFCAVDLRELFAFHQGHGAAGTIVAVQVADSSRYGSLELRPDGAVAGFSEKDQSRGQGWINGGIYQCDQTLFEHLSEGKVCSLEREILPALAAGGLYAFKTSGAFIDIGIPSEWERAQSLQLHSWQ